MSAVDDDEPVDPEIPEPPPERPVTPGSASWAQRTDAGAPPYEESADQTHAKWRARLMGATMEVREAMLEARRNRKARIAKRREEAVKRRLGDRYRGAP